MRRPPPTLPDSLRPGGARPRGARERSRAFAGWVRPGSRAGPWGGAAGRRASAGRSGPRPALRALASLALLAAAACDADFAPQYRITDPRLVAIRATVEGTARADPSPGETLALEALVASPPGRAPPAVAWYACPPRADELLLPCLDPEFLRDPGRLADVAAADAGAPAPRVVALGAGEAISLRVPGPGEPGPMAVAVQAALGFVVQRALRDPDYRCELYAELPVIAVAGAAGERSQVAVKRVRVTPTDEDLAAAREAGLVNHYVPNVNPDIWRVMRGPPGTDACGAGTVVTPGPFPPGLAVVCGVPTAESSQLHERCGPNGPERTSEDLEWQWYVTAGELPEFDGIGNATGGSVELAPPDGPFTLWAILRDGRGGADWIALELSPP